MKPTPIKVAEDLKNIFKSAEDVYNEDPNQAVFTLKDVVSLLKNYGHPEPDFAAYGNYLIANSDKSGARALQRKVGKKIEQALKERGLSKKEFAVMIGKTTSHVNKMTNGSNLEISTIFLIQEHLKIKLLNV